MSYISKKNKMILCYVCLIFMQHSMYVVFALTPDPWSILPCPLAGIMESYVEGQEAGALILALLTSLALDCPSP